MAGQIFKSGGQGVWEQGSFNKLSFIKMPAGVLPAGKGNDGFYLFNTTTNGRDYFVVGDHPREINQWIGHQEPQTGFSNRMYDRCEDRTGHDPLWEAGYVAPKWRPTIRAKASATVGIASVNAGFLVCPNCRRPCGNIEGKVWYKHHWYCSDKCLKAQQLSDTNAVSGHGEMEIARSNLAQPAPDTPFRPEIFVRGQLLSTECKVTVLNPIVDASKLLIMAGAGMSPGGSASLAGEALVDVTNSVRTGYDQISTYMAKTGGDPKPNLRPCLTISHSGGDGALSLGSGEGNSGSVTFAEIKSHPSYHTAMENLSQLWLASP